MNRRTVGGWLVAAAAGLAFLAATAGAQVNQVGLPDGGGAPQQLPGNPGTPPPPPVQQASPTYAQLQAQLDQATQGRDAAKQQYSALQAKYDGSKGGAPDVTDAAGSTSTVQGSQAKKPEVPAPGVKRPEPPPPAGTDGDKKPEKTFGSSVKKTLGAIGEATVPISLILGVCLFLFGIATLFIPALAPIGPALMVGGLVTAAGGSLLGGIFQAVAK